MENWVGPRYEAVECKSHTCVDEPLYLLQAGSSRHLSRTKPSLHQPLEASKQPPPPQPPNTKSTYDDILETLKLLEEAPLPLKESGGAAKVTPMGYLSAENLQRLTTPHGTSTSAAASRNTGAECHQGTSQSGSLSETKMHSILSYLDEMERADEDMLSQLARSRSEARTKGLPTPGGAATGGIPPLQQEEEQKYVREKHSAYWNRSLAGNGCLVASHYACLIDMV